MSNEPMTPERLALLVHESSLMRNSQVPRSVLGVSQLIDELVADRAWHRARVQVTGEDVLAAGLRFNHKAPWACPEVARVLAWVDACDRLTRIHQGSGVYLVDGENMSLVLPAWDVPAWAVPQKRGVPIARFVPVDAYAINALAEALDRAPLDVLDEIAKQKYSEMENEDSQPATIAEAVAQIRASSGKDLDEWGAMDRDDAVARVHHGFGRTIRNGWNLWGDPDRPCVLRDHMMHLGLTHADDMSTAILESLWCDLNGEAFDLAALRDRVNAHWEKMAEV